MLKGDIGRFHPSIWIPIKFTCLIKVSRLTEYQAATRTPAALRRAKRAA